MSVSGCWISWLNNNCSCFRLLDQLDGEYNSSPWPSPTVSTSSGSYPRQAEDKIGFIGHKGQWWLRWTTGRQENDCFYAMMDNLSLHIVMSTLKYQHQWMPVFQLKEILIHLCPIHLQYFVITIGEIMFSVTGLEFSYSQVYTPVILQPGIHPCPPRARYTVQCTVYTPVLLQPGIHYTPIIIQPEHPCSPTARYTPCPVYTPVLLQPGTRMRIAHLNML